MLAPPDKSLRHGSLSFVILLYVLLPQGGWTGGGANERATRSVYCTGCRPKRAPIFAVNISITDLLNSATCNVLRPGFIYGGATKPGHGGLL